MKVCTSNFDLSEAEVLQAFSRKLFDSYTARVNSFVLHCLLGIGHLKGFA